MYFFEHGFCFVTSLGICKIVTCLYSACRWDDFDPEPLSLNAMHYGGSCRWVEFPIKEDMKVDSPVLGGGGLGGSMADSFFSEDDSSIVTSSCHFSLCDAQENNLSLFGGDSVDDKADYSWDSCFGNLEDVDNLLR